MFAIKTMATAVLTGVAILGVLTGCQNQVGQRADSGLNQVAQLQISYRSQPNTVWQLSRLSCPADRSDQQRACKLLAALPGELWQPLPADQPCAMIYGGPAAARVQGSLAGQKIQQSFSRRDGCQIARWEQIAPVLSTLGLSGQ